MFCVNVSSVLSKQVVCDFFLLLCSNIFHISIAKGWLPVLLKGSVQFHPLYRSSDLWTSSSLYLIKLLFIKRAEWSGQGSICECVLAWMCTHAYVPI